MILTFLQAAVPLSKTIVYSARDAVYTVSHYPMIKRVTSMEEVVHDMYDFFEAIKQHAEKNHCLMFGQLDRPLVDESRAEHAVHTDQEWIMFDFDKVDAEPTMDGALDAIRRFLPECCQSAECVIQLSPSCFVPGTRYLSAHVFMRLSKPERAEHLKDFLIWCNFTNPELYKQIRITESGNALTFRLDRCVTDPSRLVYIAPPRCVGFEPTLGQWLGHFDGEPSFALPTFTPIPKATQHDKINELREQLGLERREFRLVKFRGTDVLQDSNPGVISDVKPSGGQYLRFNLNGGDSHAYFIDLKSPDIIRNFKGEPNLMTKEIDPDFHKKLVIATKSMPQTPRGSEATDVLAFYATNRGSKLYVGTYDREKDILRVDEANENAAASWLKQFGVPMKSLPPHYDLVYDISSNVRYEEGYPVINLYGRTDFMKQFGEADRRRTVEETTALLREHCPTIMMYVDSMCGDTRSADTFINWLAFIFQFRVKTETAWLLWGTEGTGKGKFIAHVAKPLFGEHNVSQVMLGNVDAGFNSLLEGKILINVDEAEMSRTRDKDESMAKLRNWITEPTIVVNKKNVTEREVPSFANFIITANSFRPLRINPGDRRYHVGTRNDTRLLPTANQHATLVQGTELPNFARYLGELKVDEERVRNPEMTEQKARLFEATHSLVDAVGMAIQQGDASFFFEARPNPISLGTTTSTAMLPMHQYDELLRAMLDGRFNAIRHEDLYVLFKVVINDAKLFPENQTMQRTLFNRYGLLNDFKPMHCKRLGISQHSAPAPCWQDVPEHLQELVIAPVKDDGKVTKIRGGK